MAPRVGFEPTTNRLTAGCSTAELPRITTAERVGVNTSPDRDCQVLIGRGSAGGREVARVLLPAVTVRVANEPSTLGPTWLQSSPAWRSPQPQGVARPPAVPCLQPRRLLFRLAPFDAPGFAPRSAPAQPAALSPHETNSVLAQKSRALRWDVQRNGPRDRRLAYDYCRWWPGTRVHQRVGQPTAAPHERRGAVAVFGQSFKVFSLFSTVLREVRP